MLVWRWASVIWTRDTTIVWRSIQTRKHLLQLNCCSWAQNNPIVSIQYRLLLMKSSSERYRLPKRSRSARRLGDNQKRIYHAMIQGLCCKFPLFLASTTNMLPLVLERMERRDWLIQICQAETCRMTPVKWPKGAEARQTPHETLLQYGCGILLHAFACKMFVPRQWTRGIYRLTVLKDRLGNGWLSREFGTKATLLGTASGCETWHRLLKSKVVHWPTAKFSSLPKNSTLAHASCTFPGQESSSTVVRTPKRELSRPF